jgi:hypothetical protein
LYIGSSATVYEVKSSMCLPRAAERAWNHPFLKSQCAKQAALQPAANLLEGFLCGENPIGFRCAAETCIPGNWMAADISERHGKLADCGCAFQSWSPADTRTLLAARIGFRVVDALFAGFPCAFCRCPDAPLSWDPPISLSWGLSWDSPQLASHPAGKRLDGLC